MSGFIANISMLGNILLKPTNTEPLQKIKDEVYSNGSRFSIKPRGATPHITIGQFNSNNTEIIEEIILELSALTHFTITRDQWILTKKFQNANHLMGNDYFWIALLFENNKSLAQLYQSCDELMTKYNVNDNRSYIENVKKVRQITDNLDPSTVNDLDCIANHLNISNGTRPDKADTCWDFVNSNLPLQIEFGDLVAVYHEN